MNWTKFNTHGESNNHAFEVMCNTLFKNWCKKEYGEDLLQVTFINGVGGDGGIEAFARLKNDEIIGVQSKWFPKKIEDSQIKQIRNSVETALKVRPNIKKYIVCIPRDLASKKIGRGCKISIKTESDRWNQFIESVKDTHPDIEIILWDETTIQKELVQDRNAGIYKFWFESTLIFYDQIETSFIKAQSSWAKSKYIPEVYSFGYIHDKVEYFLGSVSLNECRYRAIIDFRKRLIALNRAFSDLISLNIENDDIYLKEKIVLDIQTIDKWIEKFSSIEYMILEGNKICFEESRIELKCSYWDIKNSESRFRKYFHFNAIELLLDNIEEDFYHLHLLINDNKENYLIILGNQGTGKTAGIVAEAVRFFEEKSHLPILVHAKDFYEGDTWTDIICKSVGLSNEWSERELLAALQMSAILTNNVDSNFGINAQCVICVDGIDESKSWNFWKSKIDEVRAYKEDFPRIKFIFLSRPYVFHEEYESHRFANLIFLPTNGDSDIEALCEKYFLHYSVNIGNNTWIKQYLRTPDAVRLFCDLYRYREITELPKNTLVITNLYKKKIEELNKTFRESAQNTPNGLLKIALHEISELFILKGTISYADILAFVSSEVANYLQEILDFLIQEGFIYTYNQDYDEFESPKILYSWGKQATLEYLIAQKIYKRLKSGESISIECADGIYQMLALIAIEDGFLLFKYPEIKLNNYNMYNYICYALANCSVEIANHYREYTKALLSRSVAQFRDMINKVIIPVANIENHPLGAQLLDEFLQDFQSPAERDIWWSIPAYLNDNDKVEWKSYVEINFARLNLASDANYLSMPVVIVWTLTNTNNELRQESRKKLFKWALDNFMEFYKLFCKCTSINDFQVIEELFAIAYGLALSPTAPSDFLKVLSRWILDNVFSEAGLYRYENIIIRYYAQGIVKRAIKKGLCNDSNTNLITPRYNYVSAQLELFEDASSSERMGGYSVIDYDLARYVLCDKMEHYFKGWSNNQDDSNKILKLFKDKYLAYFKGQTFNYDGFVIAAAYHFLISQGWSPEKFYSYVDKEQLGIDILIMNTYGKATHGSRSRIMTVAEKNIWLARHKIEAVLSNELPYYKDSCEYDFIDDYSQIESFINPYQEYTIELNQNKDFPYINIDLLANIHNANLNLENIIEWIQEEYTLDFDKWFESKNDDIIISMFANVQNESSGADEAIWISSGIIKEKEFDILKSHLSSDSEIKQVLSNVMDFHAYQECNCYCSPIEACFLHSDKEVENRVIFKFEGVDVEIHKLISECTMRYEAKSDHSFMIPTIFLRELCKIDYTDGFDYFDKSGKVLAKYYDNNELWRNSQKYLLVNENSFINGLDETRFKHFWLFRVYRTMSAKARERFGDIWEEKSSTFFVLKDDTGYHHLPI